MIIRIMGGVIAALILALSFSILKSNSLSNERDLFETKLASSEARHTVTKQSLIKVSDLLKQYVDAGEVMRADVAKAATSAARAADIKRAEAAKVGAAVSENCETPAIIMQSPDL